MAWLEEQLKYREHIGAQRGRGEGERLGRSAQLLKQLRLRFGELTPVAVARVEAADVTKLDLWAERFVTAARLEDVIGPAVDPSDVPPDQLRRDRARELEDSLMLWHEQEVEGARKQGRRNGARAELLKHLRLRFGVLPTDILAGFKSAQMSELQVWVECIKTLQGVRSGDLSMEDAEEEEEEEVMVSNWHNDAVARAREQGEREGALRGCQTVLYEHLARRFGQLSGSVIYRIDMADMDELSVWAERAVTAARLEDVLGPA